MFNFFKKKESSLPSVIVQMDKYRMISQIIIAEFFLDQLLYSPEFVSLNESALRKIVSSVANLLAGRVQPLVEDSKIDLEDCIKLAMVEVLNNDLLLELVIQSRRVLSIIRYAQTQKPDTTQDFASKLLEKYGANFPTAPNTDNYPALINTFIDSLHPGLKEKALNARDSILKKG